MRQLHAGESQIMCVDGLPSASGGLPLPSSVWAAHATSSHWDRRDCKHDLSWRSRSTAVGIICIGLSAPMWHLTSTVSPPDPASLGQPWRKQQTDFSGGKFYKIPDPQLARSRSKQEKPEKGFPPRGASADRKPKAMEYQSWGNGKRMDFHSCKCINTDSFVVTRYSHMNNRRNQERGCGNGLYYVLTHSL